jgi:hypothetical protein
VGRKEFRHGLWGHIIPHLLAAVEIQIINVVVFVFVVVAAREY